MHTTPHPFAGKTVRIKKETKHPQVENFGGSDFKLEDWWDRVSGKSWMNSVGNPACMIYAMRSATCKPPLPIDNEVVYGKVSCYGHLVHVTELEEIPSDKGENK
jgi:hypothetical protein